MKTFIEYILKYLKKVYFLSKNQEYTGFIQYSGMLAKIFSDIM